MTFLLACAVLSQPIPLQMAEIKGWEAKVSLTWIEPDDPSDKELWEYRETGKVIQRNPLKVEIGRLATRNVWGGLDIPLPKEGTPFQWEEIWPSGLGAAKRTEEAEDFGSKIVGRLTMFRWPTEASAWRGDSCDFSPSSSLDTQRVEGRTPGVKGRAHMMVDPKTGFPLKMAGEWRGVPLPNGDGGGRILRYTWERTQIPQDHQR